MLSQVVNTRINRPKQSGTCDCFFPRHSPMSQHKYNNIHTRRAHTDTEAHYVNCLCTTFARVWGIDLTLFSFYIWDILLPGRHSLAQLLVSQSVSHSEHNLFTVTVNAIVIASLCMMFIHLLKMQNINWAKRVPAGVRILKAFLIFAEKWPIWLCYTVRMAIGNMVSRHHIAIASIH